MEDEYNKRGRRAWSIKGLWAEPARAPAPATADPGVDWATTLGMAECHSILGDSSPDAFGQHVRTEIMGDIAGVAMAQVDGSASLSAMRQVLRDASSNAPTSAVDSASSESGSALPEPVRRRFEEAFGGQDFASVRIHTSGKAQQAAAALNAHAYAMGTHVFFGAGEFAPGTPGGDRLLAHELTHVVQFNEGRLPNSGGVSNPSDPAEQEAYANEGRILKALQSPSEIAAPVDSPAPDGVTATSQEADQSGTKAETEADTEHQVAGPTAAIHRNEEKGQDPTRSSGPSTTEEALMGLEAPPAVAVPEAASAAPEQASLEAGEAQAPKEAAETSGGPTAGGPDLAPEGGTPDIDNQPVRGKGVAVAAPEISVPGLGADGLAWGAHARSEGARLASEIQQSASESKARIAAASQALVSRIAAAIAAAKASAHAAADSAKGAIASRKEAAIAAVTSGVGAAREMGLAGIDARAAAADAAHDAAIAAIDTAVAGEIARATTGFSARAASANELSSVSGSSGEAPVLEAQADIAQKVSEASARQCEQTATATADKLAETREQSKSGLAQLIERVRTAFSLARAAIEVAGQTLQTEAVAALESQAQAAVQKVDTDLTTCLDQLDVHGENVAEWASSTTQREHAQLDEAVIEAISGLLERHEQIASGYDQGATDIDAVVNTKEGPNEEARESIALQLAEQWQISGGALAGAAAQCVAQLTQQADGFEAGLDMIVADADTKLAEMVAGAEAGFAALVDAFGAAAGHLETTAVEVAQAGVGAALVMAEAAQAAHNTQAQAFVGEVTIQATSAVDGQLAWQDEQIEQTRGNISEGQAKAASGYDSIKAEGEAKNAKGAQASTSIQRAWLGAVWDFFSDWGDSMMEWFQEKLGSFWGSIIGGFFSLIAHAIGVIACSALWLGAQLVNLVWGFFWGETAIPGYGGGFFNFVGDMIAGILVYGDVRDIIKYFIIYPIFGKGPMWLNMTLGILSVLFLVPGIGDAGKFVFKAGKGLFKSGAKAMVEKLAKEIGEELAEKLVKELGSDAAEKLVADLGKDVVVKLGALSAKAIKELADDLGVMTLKRLADQLDGPAIKALSGDLGQEALEKLARTLGGTAIKQLNDELGPAAVKSLLTGLRGVTIKQYFDSVGAKALKNLAGDLDGYAVKELVDAFGAPVLKNLASDLGGQGVKDLVDVLGTSLVKKLGEDLSGRTIKELAEGLGGPALKKLADELAGKGIKELADGLGLPALKSLADDLSGQVIKDLSDLLGHTTLKKLAADLTGTSIKELSEKLSKETLEELAKSLSGKQIKSLFDELGDVALTRLSADFGSQGLKDVLDKISVTKLKAFIDDLGLDEVVTFGTKALAEVGPHLKPDDLMELLTSGLSGSYVRTLCEQAGAGGILKKAAAHFGSFDDLAKLLTKAQAKGVSESSVKLFLKEAPVSGWKSVDAIENFFKYAVSSSASFSDLMTWGARLTKENAGAGAKVGGRTVASGSELLGKEMFDAAGNSLGRYTLMAYDILHVQSRHTWENLPILFGKAIKGRNSFYNLGTDSGALESLGKAALDSPAFALLVQQGKKDGVVDGLGVQIDHSIKGLVSFFDTTGEELSKDALRSIVWLFKSQ